jgi:hypothetical protein
MSRNDKINFQETIRTQSSATVLSNNVTVFRKSIDPSTEVAEPHLLLEENSFPPSSTIAKDDDVKRINTLIEAIHANTFKKEEQQPPQISSLPLSSQNLLHAIPTVTTQSSPEEIHNLTHTRRTVTFDDDQIPFQSIRTSNVNFRLSTRNSIPNDQQDKESIKTPHSSDTIVASGQMSLTAQDLNNLVSNITCIISVLNLSNSI